MSIRLAVLLAGAALVLGPPNIKVDVVSNPATAPVKDAVLIVTGRHHVTADQVVVSGRREGMVDGKRVSEKLTLTPAGSPGVYGVTKQWTAGQPWVLVFTVSTTVHDPDGLAEAVVRIGADGKVVGTDYPMGKLAGGYPWPRAVTAREIETALVAMTPRRQ